MDIYAGNESFSASIFSIVYLQIQSNLIEIN